MTTATDRRPTRRLTATARPFPAPMPPRLRAALAVLAVGRAPGADYRPEDLPVLAAWEEARDRCATQRGTAREHLDAFLAVHLDALRDLALRARDGMGPTTFLDEVERTLIAYA